MKEEILKHCSKYPPDRLLCTKRRGIMIGNLEHEIRAVVEKLHVEGPHGISRQLRDIRLELASYVFDREITSFNQLTDQQMRGLNDWVQFGNTECLADYIKEKFGEQLQLL